jgi:hypothetical protein
VPATIAQDALRQAPAATDTAHARKRRQDLMPAGAVEQHHDAVLIERRR